MKKLNFSEGSQKCIKDEECCTKKPWAIGNEADVDDITLTDMTNNDIFFLSFLSWTKQRKWRRRQLWAWTKPRFTIRPPFKTPTTNSTTTNISSLFAKRTKVGQALRNRRCLCNLSTAFRPRTMFFMCLSFYSRLFYGAGIWVSAKVLKNRFQELKANVAELDSNEVWVRT